MPKPRSSKKVWITPDCRPIEATPDTVRQVALFLSKMREDVAR